MNTIDQPADTGTTLRAVDALNDQQTFTRSQVAYLMSLAYQSGRAARHDQALTDLRASWTARPFRPTSREQRIRAEVDAMAAYAAKQPTTWRGRYPGGPVDWETGRPVRSDQRPGVAA